MRSARRLAPAVVGLTLLLAACQPAWRSTAPSSEQVAEAFVAQVVLPQYQQLVEGSQHLAAALDALAAEPGAERIAAAREAWQQVRAIWEASEAWAFGPAETGGFDGNLDDWPVNEKDLGTALASVAVTPELFARLTTTAKGFHGIEAVLFGLKGQRPQASQLSAAELTYLRRAGADLAANAKGLLAAWEGPSGFGSTFTTQPEEAMAEILQGMVGTLEEVAAEKLGAPIGSGSPRDFESFYSDNTRADIVANLAGVQEALRRSGLLDRIRARDARLASSLDQALEQSLASARALPAQLNAQLKDKAARERIQAVIANSTRSAALLKEASALVS